MCAVGRAYLFLRLYLWISYIDIFLFSYITYHTYRTNTTQEEMSTWHETDGKPIWCHGVGLWTKSKQPDESLQVWFLVPQIPPPGTAHDI